MAMSRQTHWLLLIYQWSKVWLCFASTVFFLNFSLFCKRMLLSHYRISGHLDLGMRLYYSRKDTRYQVLPVYVRDGLAYRHAMRNIILILPKPWKNFTTVPQFSMSNCLGIYEVRSQQHACPAWFSSSSRRLTHTDYVQMDPLKQPFLTSLGLSWPNLSMFKWTL